MKYLIKESQYNNAIDKFISHQFEPHKEIRTKKYPESIFWIKDGEVIAEIKELAFFWVSNQIWKNINVMFSLEYDETQQVIKEWLEEHYGLGGLTPAWINFSNEIMLEEH